MKLIKDNPTVIFVIYFLILVSLSIFVHDVSGQLDALNATIVNIANDSLYGDPKYFATAANDIVKNGWISSENSWIFDLWPPGFVLLQAIIVKVGGPDIPVIFVMQIIISFLYAYILWFLYKLIKNNFNKLLAFFLPLILFAFPMPRYFLLQPTGISLGEGFAIGFFIIFILLSIRSHLNGSIYDSCLSGFFLSLAVYFRSQFELLLLALTVFAVVIFIITLSSYFYTKKHEIVVSSVKFLLITLLAAHMLTFPWRIYHFIDRGSFDWVYTSRLVYENSVKTSEDLVKDGGAWLVKGGGGITCLIDPETCGNKINSQKLFWKTFVSNPIKWSSAKIKIIGPYWFSNFTQTQSSPLKETNNYDIIFNSFFLLFIFVSLFFLFCEKMVSERILIPLIWINCSVYSAYFLIFLFVHLEVRYLFFPKIFGFIMMIISGYFYFSSSREGFFNKKCTTTI